MGSHTCQIQYQTRILPGSSFRWGRANKTQIRRPQPFEHPAAREARAVYDLARLSCLVPAASRFRQKDRESEWSCDCTAIPVRQLHFHPHCRGLESERTRIERRKSYKVHTTDQNAGFQYVSWVLRLSSVKGSQSFYEKVTRRNCQVKVFQVKPNGH